MMAAFEASNSGVHHINQHIEDQCLPHRSLEAIEGTRRPAAYKERVRQEALRLQSASSAPANASPTSPPEVQQQRSPSNSPVRSGASTGEDEPSSPLRSSEEDVLAHVGREAEALGLSIPSQICEVEAQVNQWNPPRAYAYRPPGLVKQGLSQKKRVKG